MDSKTTFGALIALIGIAGVYFTVTGKIQKLWAPDKAPPTSSGSTAGTPTPTPTPGPAPSPTPTPTSGAAPTPAPSVPTPPPGNFGAVKIGDVSVQFPLSLPPLTIANVDPLMYGGQAAPAQFVPIGGAQFGGSSDPTTSRGGG